MLTDFVETHGGQHRDRLLVTSLTKRHPEEAANRMLGRNVAGAWRFCLSGVSVAYDLQAHAIGISKAEHLFFKPLARALHRDAGAEQSLFPKCQR